MIERQLAISHNLGETPATRCKRLAWSVVYLAKALAIGVRGMFREQLGERVTYDGKPCFVNNWAGSESPCLADGKGFYIEHAERSRMKRVGGVKEKLHRFRVMWNWYVTNWHDIDVQNRLY